MLPENLYNICVEMPKLSQHLSLHIWSRIRFRRVQRRMYPYKVLNSATVFITISLCTAIFAFTYDLLSTGIPHDVPLLVHKLGVGQQAGTRGLPRQQLAPRRSGLQVLGRDEKAKSALARRHEADGLGKAGAASHCIAHDRTQAVGAHDEVGMPDGPVCKLNPPLLGVYPCHGRGKLKQDAVCLLARCWPSRLRDVGQPHEFPMQVYPVNGEEGSAKLVGGGVQILAGNSAKVYATDGVPVDHLDGLGPFKVKAEMLEYLDAIWRQVQGCANLARKG